MTTTNNKGFHNCLYRVTLINDTDLNEAGLMVSHDRMMVESLHYYPQHIPED